MKNLALLLLLFYTTAHAQNTYRISYVQESYFADESKKSGVRSVKSEGGLVFNDSLSFYYLPFTDRKKDSLEKLSLIGDKLLHHGMMYNLRSREILEEVAWPQGKYFVIVDSPKHYSWVLSDNEKNILGYKCKLAYSVNNSNDTITVWYAAELKKAFGPSIYFGVPGLVLEVFDQLYATHFVATKAAPVSLTLMLPQNVERITADKYRQQKSATINK